ncbi:hypothetical protein BDZ94DRAFT_1321217 [Collybia nuda]|uniref:Uncharacterized protein n=1 Tax=Collybia nuda TaxID=64659 RepID=A0A9P6CJH4_9AGAR|nr:hypothetical protein BDZ94DRAFT_1321217 [Collybia nuda]
MDPHSDPVCPACDRVFLTMKGLHSHLTSAKSCKWYKKGKIASFDFYEEAKEVEEVEVIEEELTEDNDSYNPVGSSLEEAMEEIWEEMDQARFKYISFYQSLS